MSHKGFDQYLRDTAEGKSILILGYGREGKSSLQQLERILPKEQLGIADLNPSATNTLVQSGYNVFTGPSYLEALQMYDIILRSPGIQPSLLKNKRKDAIITSQSALFLAYFHDQVIGITGTKGKSTTATLTNMMLNNSGLKSFLAGNIGLPPFELADKMEDGVWAVLEMSAHQLEDITRGPRLASLLNLYEEHLDHFRSTQAYFAAKWRIFISQKAGDTGLYPLDSAPVQALIREHLPPSGMLGYSSESVMAPFYLEDETICLQTDQGLLKVDAGDRPGLPGKHNLLNSLVASALVSLAGGNAAGIQATLKNYKGLPHRMQYLGLIDGIHCYNDAIATAPEATIAAIETLSDVTTLILGGMDRGIDYDPLVTYLIQKRIPCICTSGPAGKRIVQLLRDAGATGMFYYDTHFSDAVQKAKGLTPHSGTLLFSPSASSYDEFKDFAEKGRFFEHLLRSPSSHAV